MEIINKFLGLFYDKTTSLSHKLSYLIIFSFAIFIVEYHFDFTYNFYLNNKIEQLNNLNDLKTVYSKDSLKIKELTQIENRVLERTHYSDFLRNLSLNDFNVFRKTDKPNEINSVNNKDLTIINKPIRSRFWMIVSSNYVLILIFILMLFLPITHKRHRKGDDLAGLIAALIIIFVLTLIITWISFQIPLIYGKPLYNYILNVIIHFIFMIPIFRLFK